MKIITSVFILLFAIMAFADPVAPKARIEREFRQLEAAVSRLMYNTVLPASDVVAMNRAIYEFTRENPGVSRILRTNAAGITVNDVGAESPESEPARNVSAQRWYQYVERNKSAYYSMDTDGIDGITLFYAWPLLTGPQKDRFAGVFAAVIDFAAQVALIDDTAPFQLTYRGKAFFQHEWDDVDYSEAALDVKGVSGITIRTEQPLPTRGDPPPARRRAAIVEEDIIPDEHDISEASRISEDDKASVRKKTRKKKEASGISTGMVILIVIISTAAAYLIFKYTDSSRRSAQFVMEDVPPEPKTSVIVRSMTEPPKPPESAPPPVPPPSKPPMPPPTPASELDAEKMGKMLLLIKEEFVAMDKKIQFLAQRVNILERRR